MEIGKSSFPEIQSYKWGLVSDDLSSSKVQGINPGGDCVLFRAVAARKTRNLRQEVNLFPVDAKLFYSRNWAFPQTSKLYPCPCTAKNPAQNLTTPLPHSPLFPRRATSKVGDGRKGRVPFLGVIKPLSDALLPKDAKAMLRRGAVAPLASLWFFFCKL